MATKKETDDSPSYAYLAPIQSPLNDGALRVRVVVDRLDGEPLTSEDIAAAEKLYPQSQEQSASAPARKSAAKKTKKRSAAKRRG